MSEPSSAPNENRGPALLSVNIVFCVLAGIVVILRCYTRAVLVKAFGLDDWTMVVATLLFIIYCTMSNCGVHYGTGQHMDNLDHASIEYAMKYWWFCYLFFSLTMVACKLSFAWFLLRITTKRLHSWIIYGASLCTVIAGLAFFFVTLFQCNPISFYWNKDQTGRCLEMNIIMALAYVYSAFSVITDFTFAILPAFVIWNLQLKMRAKFALIVLVTMGCLASAAVVVRFGYLPRFNDPDFLWATLDIAIWSTVEMGLSIITASLATLRPLSKIVFWKLGLTTRGTTTTNTLNLGGSRHVGGTRDPFRTDNTSEDRIYVTSHIVLADSHPNRDSQWKLGVQSSVYADVKKGSSM